MAGNHNLPARDARAIFTSAEDFWHASRKLFTAENWRVTGPQIVCGAFAIELFLKCILVDCGATTIPAKHDLLLIYNNIPKQTRAEILKVWAEFTRPTFPDGLEEVLSRGANLFDRWRYRFELPQNVPGLEITFPKVQRLLHYFILTKHPDWQDEDRYFWSTFPAL